MIACGGQRSKSHDFFNHSISFSKTSSLIQPGSHQFARLIDQPFPGILAAHGFSLLALQKNVDIYLAFLVNAEDPNEGPPDCEAFSLPCPGTL